jgi:hypothetical protein
MPCTAEGFARTVALGAAMGGVAGGLGAAFDMVEGAAGAFGGCSFTPQTTVLMADGSREPISKLKPGDMVEAYDPATGKTGPHRVTVVMVNRDPATEHLVTSAGSIETTPNHPFYTTDGGWIPAGQLRIGEHVRTATDTDALVVSFTVDPHPARMWDITVAGAHSFFVGSGEVLVHNCGPTLPANGSTMSTSEALDLADEWLGPGYADMGGGRFASVDGLRQFRMGLSDITGAHGGGPHVNFETWIPDAWRPGRFVRTSNIHIFLGDAP